MSPISTSTVTAATAPAGPSRCPRHGPTKATAVSTATQPSRTAQNAQAGDAASHHGTRPVRNDEMGAAARATAATRSPRSAGRSGGRSDRPVRVSSTPAATNRSAWASTSRVMYAPLTRVTCRASAAIEVSSAWRPVAVSGPTIGSISAPMSAGDTPARPTAASTVGVRSTAWTTARWRVEPDVSRAWS